jgi:hypothetical protein
MTARKNAKANPPPIAGFPLVNPLDLFIENIQNHSHPGAIDVPGEPRSSTSLHPTETKACASFPLRF